MLYQSLTGTRTIFAPFRGLRHSGRGRRLAFGSSFRSVVAWATLTCLGQVTGAQSCTEPPECPSDPEILKPTCRAAPPRLSLSPFPLNLSASIGKITRGPGDCRLQFTVQKPIFVGIGRVNFLSRCLATLYLHSVDADHYPLCRVSVESPFERRSTRKSWLQPKLPRSTSSC